MAHKFKIMKFGGSVLNNVKAPEKMLNIIEKTDSYPVIVISAFDKTTQMLKDAAYDILKNNGKSNDSNLNKIISYHNNFIDSLIEDKNNAENAKNQIHQKHLEINNILKGIEITKEVTRKTLDNIMSYGEELAMIVLKNVFDAYDIKGRYIDSKELIFTDDNYGEAKPIVELSADNVKKIIPDTGDSYFTMIPGFTAITQKGFKSTMGFESSNLTAVLIADFLNIKNIQIWTDVEGIRNADPDIFANTYTIKNINYDEAYIAALNGVKLFYPLMLYYAKQNNITIEYRSFLKTNGDFSIINNTKTQYHKIITYTDDLSHYYVEENLDNIKTEKNINVNLDEYEYLESKKAGNTIFNKTINPGFHFSNNDHNNKALCYTILNPSKNDDFKVIELLKELDLEFIKFNAEKNIIQLFIHNFQAEKLSQKFYDVLFLSE